MVFEIYNYSWCTNNGENIFYLSTMVSGGEKWWTCKFSLVYVSKFTSFFSIKIERILPVADEYKKQQLSYLLSKRTYYSISEKHLWFSIFLRPPSKTFSCVQRCTYSFVTLFISMLFNIIYYDQISTDNSRPKSDQLSLSLGVAFITVEQVCVWLWNKKKKV